MVFREQSSPGALNSLEETVAWEMVCLLGVQVWRL